MKEGSSRSGSECLSLQPSGTRSFFLLKERMQQYVELYRKMNEILGMFASDLKKKKMLLSIYFVLHFAREHSD